MTLSMYDASVPGFIRSLKALDAIIDKAVTWAEAKKIEPAALINFRLAPDMGNFAKQIQIATDGVKAGAARLAQVDIPSYPDTETTFPELKERIGKTIAFLEGVEAARFEGAEDRTVALKLGSNDVTFPAKHYLFSFVIPNFYFHATTAYDILRHNGLEIGKRDFLGEL